MRRVAPAVLAVLVLAVSGCGSSSKSAEATFRARANAICATAKERAKPLAAEKPLPFEQIADLLSETAKKLSEIQPPQQSASAYGTFLGYVAEEAALLKRIVSEFEAHDLAAVRATLGKLNSNLSNEQAQRLGLKECEETIHAEG
jgi:hypothetical protein